MLKNTMDKDKSTIDQTLVFDDEYIFLPIKLKVRPSFKYQNTVFKKRPEFHVSIFCLKNFSIAQQQKITKLSKEFFKENQIQINQISSKLYHITRDDRQSIIIRVSVSGIRKYYQYLSRKLNTKLLVPPTHITLYSLPGGKGIGINSFNDLKKLGKLIPSCHLATDLIDC